MILYVRMALYFFFAFLSSQGVGVFDPNTSSITISVDQIEVAASGAVGFIATFLFSRVAKRIGWAT